MFKIRYLDKVTNEVKENTYNTLTEERALDIYRREIAAIPWNYSIVEIINVEEQGQIDNYFIHKKNYINEVLKQVEKAQKDIIKKPYTSSNKKKIKTVNVNSFMHDIETNIKNIDDSKIEIAVRKDKIIIEPTEEYFIKAD